MQPTLPGRNSTVEYGDAWICKADPNSKNLNPRAETCPDGTLLGFYTYTHIISLLLMDTQTYSHIGLCKCVLECTEEGKEPEHSGISPVYKPFQNAMELTG